MQAWAVVLPRDVALMERAQQAGRALTEETARELVVTDLRRLERDIAPYKRMSDIMLVDTPLPKTPLRKVKRFEVGRMLAAGELHFTVEQLHASATALAAAAAAASPAAARG